MIGTNLRDNSGIDVPTEHAEGHEIGGKGALLFVGLRENLVLLRTTS